MIILRKYGIIKHDKSLERQTMRFAETETIELKEKLNDNFIKVIDSFLNTINGVVYIGVK